MIYKQDEETDCKDIEQDVKDECNKYGRVLTIIVPKKEGDENIPGYGNAYVEFLTLEESKEARRVFIN